MSSPSRIFAGFDPVRDSQQLYYRNSPSTNSRGSTASSPSPTGSPGMDNADIYKDDRNRRDFKRLRIEDLLGPTDDGKQNTAENQQRLSHRGNPQEVLLEHEEARRKKITALSSSPPAGRYSDRHTAQRNPSSPRLPGKYSPQRNCNSSRIAPYEVPAPQTHNGTKPILTWTPTNIPGQAVLSSDELDTAHFAALLSTRETKQRQQYSREFRMQAITYTKVRTGMVQDGGVPLAPEAQLSPQSLPPSLSDRFAPRITKYRAAKIIGITPKMLQDWMDREESIVLQKRGQMRGNSGRKAELPELEDELHARWTSYREEGRMVSRKWWKSEAREIYESLYPEKVQVESHSGSERKIFEFKFSRSWLIRFKERYGIDDDESHEFDISEDEDESDQSIIS